MDRDLASAVQSLLAYEASLKLGPGQKPAPPSPSHLDQLSDAVAAISSKMESVDSYKRISGLPPSVWSDWPLCCGLDLTPKELQAARSLPPSLLRERGLLCLFLALHSCAEAGIGRAGMLAPYVLFTLAKLHDSEQEDPAPFPSAHLAVRVGHRLINADDTLDFGVDLHGERWSAIWTRSVIAPLKIIHRASEPNHELLALPHEAAGLSLAKEMAVMLDALCAAQRVPDSYGQTRGRGLPNRLPFPESCMLIRALEMIMMRAEATPLALSLRSGVYREAVSLPAYNPVLLLQWFTRNTSDLRPGGGSMRRQSSSVHLADCRVSLWTPLMHFSTVGKLRPADAYTAMRLGLEDLRPEGPDDDDWFMIFLSFFIHAIHSGLVRPELILRARPQLLEGLVECLARGSIARLHMAGLMAAGLMSLLTRSPAVGFHLRKFFSRSGCLQAAMEHPEPDSSRWELIRLLGPRAAQPGFKPRLDGPTLLAELIDWGRSETRVMAEDKVPLSVALICDFVIRDLTLHILRDAGRTQPLLQYLSELTEEIAAPKRPYAQYGVLMVVGLGKACLALSKIVATALKDIREAGPKGKSSRGPGGAGASTAGIGQQGWRARLVDMGRQMSLLRRRVLHELLPLAEAREAALWEGVREEEVVAALRGEA